MGDLVFENTRVFQIQGETRTELGTGTLTVSQAQPNILYFVMPGIFQYSTNSEIPAWKSSAFSYVFPAQGACFGLVFPETAPPGSMEHLQQLLAQFSDLQLPEVEERPEAKSEEKEGYDGEAEADRMAVVAGQVKEKYHDMTLPTGVVGNAKASFQTQIAAFNTFMAGGSVVDDDPEIAEAREQLKSTKNQLMEASKRLQKLYLHKKQMIEQQRAMITRLQNPTGEESSAWRMNGIEMSSRLEQVLVQEEIVCQRLKTEVVDPLNQFFKEDVQYAQDLKTQYKVAKSGYEYALAAHNKAKHGSHQGKKEAAQKKLDEKQAVMEQLRDQFKECVRMLMGKKNSSIRELLEKFYEINISGLRQCAASTV